MCGIVGVWNARKAAELTVVGLHANQHRAIDYVGIVTTDGYNLFRERGPGLARQVFTDKMLNALHGKAAIGHIRYPTVDNDPKDVRDNIQPIMGVYRGSQFAVAHNGNITNGEEVAKHLQGVRLATTMDSEWIVRLLEKYASGDVEADIITVAKLLKGSFSLLFLFRDRMIALVDPSGCRPLSWGKNGDEGIYVSSETCAFPNLNAVHVGDIEPGTMHVWAAGGHRVEHYARAHPKHCRFEGIYYSHPSSRVFDENISRFRVALGKALEELYPVPGADLVTPVPDSSNFIAMGYASSGRSGEYYPVITRNHYVGRSFIAAKHLNRSDIVAQKFNFTANEIVGKSIVVIDDSIVRSTTLPIIVEKLREMGAREVHVRIGCPPIKYPCKYGVDIRSRDELVAAKYTEEEIRELTGATTLKYMMLDRLRSLSQKPNSFCYACMDGKYWD